MSDKIKELVAIGASFTVNCQPCLQYHAEKAAEFGATADEIASAIEIGRCVRKGAGAKMDKFAAPFTTAAETETGRAQEAGCCMR
jgi:AhpD family alkylhydroperoxidase